jgi:hypothetical protein
MLDLNGSWTRGVRHPDCHTDANGMASDTITMHESAPALPSRPAAFASGRIKPLS